MLPPLLIFGVFAFIMYISAFGVLGILTALIGAVPFLLDYKKPSHQVLLLMPPVILIAIFLLNIDKAEGLNAVGLFILIAFLLGVYVLAALIKVVYLHIKTTKKSQRLSQNKNVTIDTFNS